MKYRYGILRSDLSTSAEGHNSSLLGEFTLGIEVTIPEFATRCGLGNIDPQHGGGQSSAGSAIEETLATPLPQEGSCLVTIRPDKDSLGAMAVLTLRAENRHVDHQLVAWIGLMDSVGFQNARNSRPDLMPPDASQTDAIQVIISNQDRWPRLEEKVAAIAEIVSGEMPQQKIYDIATIKNRSTTDFNVEFCGEVALITAPGKYNQARDWGNRRFSVALIFDSEYPTGNGNVRERWTVVRRPGHFDRRGFEKAINAAEAEAQGVSVEELVSRGYSWGGPVNIVSQSQRKPSALTKETIVAIVRQHAESDRVS